MKRLALAAASALVFASACADLTRDHELPASETGCEPGVAQIHILDGMAKRLCGCVESSDTLIAPPATVDCTVAAGTQVYFRFEGVFTWHQIIFTGAGLEDFNGHLVRVDEWISFRPHVVTFNASATYPFQDAFNSDVRGSIIVP